MCAKRTRGWVVVWVALAAWCLAGCGSESSAPQPAAPGGESSPAAQGAGTQTGQPAAAGQADTQPAAGQSTGPAGAAEPPPEPVIPPVKLTESIRQTCLVQVGQPFPVGAAELGRLQDMRGTSAGEVSWGNNLTVICFWQLGDSERDRLSARDMLEFLDKDIARQFGAQGVRVVCVHVGQSAGLGGLDPDGEIHVPCLIDPQGELFSRVASNTQYMPRIFLLDAQGRVLWFDVEYSSATRRYLREAIEVALGGLQAKPGS